jgi:hypothetical protein
MVKRTHLCYIIGTLAVLYEFDTAEITSVEKSRIKLEYFMKDLRASQ